MLSSEQVKEVLTSPEADRIERTRSVTNTDKFREAICSFSNDMPGHGKPGYLLIGVEDDGSLSTDLAIHFIRITRKILISENPWRKASSGFWHCTLSASRLEIRSTAR